MCGKKIMAFIGILSVVALLNSAAAQAVNNDELKGKLKTLRELRKQKAGAIKQYPVILSALQSNNLNLRSNALEILQFTGVADADIELIKKIVTNGEDDLYLRMLALRALASANSKGDAREKSIAFLLGQLGNKNQDIAYYAATSLCGKTNADSQQSAEIAEKLVAELGTKNEKQFRFALFALAELGRNGKPGYLADTLNKSDVKTQLLALMKDSDYKIRRNALEALGSLYGATVVEEIKPMLQDSSKRVALAAAHILSAVIKDNAELDNALADYRKRATWKENKNRKSAPEFSKAELKKYEYGGPLAGLKLPLFPAPYTKTPGHPGGSYGGPERVLYDGSVEHWRAYWFKYCPVRSFYDKASLLKNWQAVSLPDVTADMKKEYAEPIYNVLHYSGSKDTGEKMPAVPVVLTGVKSPVFNIDCGELKEGLYAIRVIAAVPVDTRDTFLKPLYFGMKVNDGLNDETNTYRIRTAYNDQFYGIAEMYFHAPVKRDYKVRIFVDKGSEVKPLTHNIELHDVLAGVVKMPLKHSPSLAKNPEKVDYHSKYLSEERIKRDRDLWRAMPNINKQSGYYGSFLTKKHYQSPKDVVSLGMNGMTKKEIEAKYGKWSLAKYPAFLINRKLGLVYTYKDYLGGNPLPDPYPFKDAGAGLFKQDKGGKTGQAFIPVASQAQAKIRYYGMGRERARGTSWGRNYDSDWPHGKKIDGVHDEAMRLIRIAYDCPTYESSHSLHNVTSNPAPYGRDSGLRQRETQPHCFWLAQYGVYKDPAYFYDTLFTYIDGNEELADAVGEFVPWVKSPKDVVKLMDSYLLQTLAKRVLRYQYYTNHSTLAAADIALILQDKAVSKPWMDFIFSRAYTYPMPLEGIQNLFITSHDRGGSAYIASSFYAMGGGALDYALKSEKYIKAGLFPKQYDFRRDDLYPKSRSNINWHIDIITHGHDLPRIGDVTGPDKSGKQIFDALARLAPLGWKWYKDPRYAWIIKNINGRGEQWSDKEWKEITTAAATIKRAPWLDNRSRFIANWAGLLETGLKHDDYRFRGSVAVRTGVGIGHAHADGLDLQIFSQGLPMTPDGGQRPGYSAPIDAATKVHNLVLVEKGKNLVPAWINTINDTDGARYLEAQAANPGTSIYRRQVALIDIDSGKGSQKLTAAQQKYGAKLPTKGIMPANSYVVDFFRAKGGKYQIYCFHGPVTDDVTVNAENMKEIVRLKKDEKGTSEQEFLRSFGMGMTPLVGDGKDETVAIWRYTRKGVGREQMYSVFDPESPRKFLKITIFGTKGLKVMRAEGVRRGGSYKLDHLFVEKKSTDGAPVSAVFAAVMEPYSGKPAITSKRLLKIENNDQGADAAAAVEVKTVNGHTDITFADTYANKVRKFENFRIAGEFAFHSTDAKGLRLATLSGGKLLEAPDLVVETDKSNYSAKIIKVDYLKKEMYLDTVWPESVAGRVTQVFAPGRITAYTIKSARQEKTGTVLAMLKGAANYSSMIDGIAGQVVKCRLSPSGGDKGFSVVSDDGTKHWHADYNGDKTWTLSGGPVSRSDFSQSNVLKTYEYGVGDTLKIRTQVSLVRQQSGSYLLTGNVACTIKIKGKSLMLSPNNKDWKKAGEATGDGWMEIKIDASNKPLFLTVK